MLLGLFLFTAGLVVLTETLTELIVKSQIFESPRNFLKRKSPWLKKMLSCGYCTSVWVALALSFLSGVPCVFTGKLWLDWILFSLVVHRGSNYLHNFNDKHLDKYFDLRYTSSHKEDE